MIRWLLILFTCILPFSLSEASTLKQSYDFSYYTINHNSHTGFDEITLNNSISTAQIGRPAIPFVPCVVLLNPSEEAVSISVQFSDSIQLPTPYLLAPQQPVLPLFSAEPCSVSFNHEAYTSPSAVPEEPFTHVTTGYMNGYAIATALVSPVRYVPSKKLVTIYTKVVVTITTQPTTNHQTASSTISTEPKIVEKIRSFVDNPGALSLYSPSSSLHDTYDLLIITVAQLTNDFQPLIDFYKSKQVLARLRTVDTITSSMQGKDIQEKIRNCIKQEYTKSNIKYVLLGGDVNFIPHRGMFTSVTGLDGTKYEDKNIPADIYYSALDGTFNANGNNLFGEKDVDSVDFLPDIAVGRLPAANTQELQAMVSKIIRYQQKPIVNTFQQPLLIGEKLDDSSFGGDGLDLLIGKSTASDFETEGIPKNFTITKLYDTKSKTCTKSEIIQKINAGPSAIYHSGHSQWNTNMRMTLSDITDNTFSKLNGTDNNFTFVNTVGCICGSFDKSDCIGEKMVKINTFAVAFIGNSRYGWYYPGSADGPSNRLQRFFVHALYTEKMTRIGSAFMYSKAKFAPFIDQSGEPAFGARRWCYYTNNLLGDPAMNLWIKNDQSAINTTAFFQQNQIPLLHVTSKGRLFTITFSTRNEDRPLIQVLDIKGRCVRVLQHNHTFSQQHPTTSVTWNAQSIAAGKYFISIQKSHNSRQIACITITP